MAGGRPKGSTDRLNTAIKEMIIASLDEVGGKDYFVKQATENPVAYMTLIGKILPKDVNVGGQIDNPVTYTLKPDDYKILESLGVQVNAAIH